MRRAIVLGSVVAFLALGQVTKIANTPALTGIQSGEYVYCASAAGTDSYACNLAPAITAYTVGMVVNIKADVANTGACSLALNGLAAKAIKRGHDVDPADGEIEVGQIVTVAYDGTTFQIQSQTALGGGAIGGFSALPTPDIIPRVSAAGVLGPSALSDDGVKMFTTAARTFGFGLATRTGNTEPGTTKFVLNDMDLAVMNSTTLGSESVADGTFTVPTWTRTGDFTVNTGAAVYTHASGVGTFTQLNASMTIAMAPAKWYKLVGDVSTTGTAPVCVLTSATADTSGGLSATLRTAAGVTVDLLQFKSAAAPTDFVTSCTSGAAGTVTFDNLSLKEIQGGIIDAYGPVNSSGGTIYGGSGKTSQIIKLGLSNAHLDYVLQVQSATGATLGGFYYYAGTLYSALPIFNSGLFTTSSTTYTSNEGIRLGATATAYSSSSSIALMPTATGIAEFNSGQLSKWAGLKSGTIVLQSLATPVITSVTPSANDAVTCTYVLVARQADNVTSTAASAAVSTAVGPTDCNHNHVVWTSDAAATYYQLSRTVGGTTQGLITSMAAWLNNTTNCPAGVCEFIDANAAASGTAPILNQTGMLKMAAAVTPTTSADPCTAGNIWWDASYIYVCTATGVVKRAGIAAW